MPATRSEGPTSALANEAVQGLLRIRHRTVTLRSDLAQKERVPDATEGFDQGRWGGVEYLRVVAKAPAAPLRASAAPRARIRASRSAREGDQLRGDVAGRAAPRRAPPAVRAPALRGSFTIHVSTGDGTHDLQCVPLYERAQLVADGPRGSRSGSSIRRSPRTMSTMYPSTGYIETVPGLGVPELQLRVQRLFVEKARSSSPFLGG